MQALLPLGVAGGAHGALPAGPERSYSRAFLAAVIEAAFAAFNRHHQGEWPHEPWAVCWSLPLLPGPQENIETVVKGILQIRVWDGSIHGQLCTVVIFVLCVAAVPGANCAAAIRVA